MIITKNILNEKVPIEMMPTRLDSAMNLYTNVKYNNTSGIIVYNTDPNNWNGLYSFYELNHKFTIDNYSFNKKNQFFRIDFLLISYLFTILEVLCKSVDHRY